MIEGASFLPDFEIKRLCEEREPPMIEPFVPVQAGKPTYGLGSVGYDIRLGRKILIPKFSGINLILDPRRFPKEMFTIVELGEDEETFEIAPHSSILAESIEYFHMPDDVFAICTGKSTYARCGIFLNFTVAEPGWKGRLTLEISNLSSYPVRLYIGHGIGQMLFFKTPRPKRTYPEKEAGGLYQHQEGVTLPR